MPLINMSERFAQKLEQSIPELNQELYPFGKGIKMIQDAGEVPSPTPRISRSQVFTSQLGELLSRHFGGFLVPVTDTNSMDPWIDSGHRALVIPFQTFSPFRKEDIQPGDIVLFDRQIDNAQNILHRVTEVKEDGKLVLTKGDNTVIDDGATGKDRVNFLCVGVIY